MIDLKNFKVVKAFYKLLFYFELGRGTASRFYSWIPEIIIILMGIKFLLKVELNGFHLVFLFSSISILFCLLGLFMKKSGLYDVDVYVQASKNPVTNEILEGVRKIK